MTSKNIPEPLNLASKSQIILISYTQKVFKISFQQIDDWIPNEPLMWRKTASADLAQATWRLTRCGSPVQKMEHTEMKRLLSQYESIFLAGRFSNFGFFFASK